MIKISLLHIRGFMGMQKYAKSRSCCFHVFKGEIYQTSNEEKFVKTFIKHCLKDING